jgi:replication fork protection complex subunit Tof1/Swi1
LEKPIDLQGKKATQMLSKKGRRRRVRAGDSEPEGAYEDDDDEPRRKKTKEKKQKEQEQYKSAQFIEDSDEEYGNIEEFLELEKQRREKAAVAGNMKATGTKKRRKSGEGGVKKRRKGDSDPMVVDNDSTQSDSEVDDTEEPPERPKPRPITPRKSLPDPAGMSDAEIVTKKKRNRLVISDDEEEG